MASPKPVEHYNLLIISSPLSGCLVTATSTAIFFFIIYVAFIYLSRVHTTMLMQPLGLWSVPFAKRNLPFLELSSPDSKENKGKVNSGVKPCLCISAVVVVATISYRCWIHSVAEKHS